MFTGIVTDLGRVRSVETGEDARFEFETGYDTATVEIGASIACSGACLTVTEKGEGWFAATVSGETLRVTTLGRWTEGTPVNFERPLRADDELGGHMVLGHVDGVGEILSVTPVSDSACFRIRVPDGLKRYVAQKGSITVDGVSLTVNEAGGDWFEVNIIPHTRSVTTFGTRKAGDLVNLEIDLLARYVARLLGKE